MQLGPPVAQGVQFIQRALRIYLEAFDPDVANHHLDAQAALSELIGISGQLSQLVARTGRVQPTVIT